MANPILAQTIGFELEIEDISRNRLNRTPNVYLTSDASVEKDGFVVGNNITLIPHTNTETLNLDRATLGVEILSNIIDTEEDYLAFLKNLCKTLLSLGESERSQRAGFHVHLSYSTHNINIMKSALKVGAYLEDVFFLLGGMGYEFRGLKNDSIYCRPITHFGPQVVEDRNGNYYPCFVLEDLYGAKNDEEFRRRLGDILEFGDSRYIPIRYSWLNLFNLFNSKNTLEFRVFNKSLNPMYLYTIIEICKHFGQYALVNSFKGKSLPVNSIFDYREKNQIINTFLDWIQELNIPDYIVSTAIEIMERTPIDSIRLPRQWVFSHLRFHRQGNRCPAHWSHSNYRPSISIEANEVKPPNFIDIHNLRANESIPIRELGSSPRNSPRNSPRTSPRITPNMRRSTPSTPNLTYQNEALRTNSEIIDRIVDNFMNTENIDVEDEDEDLDELPNEPDLGDDE